ncbi:MAG: hypothetical protein KIT83_14815 [Bryobacterales bacterium]|nr:hypothetical protein [Bryobacterales bacterium]
MDAVAIEKALWWLNVPLLGILALRLGWNGMGRRYPAFWFLVGFLSIRNGLLELFVDNVARFYRFWIITEPVVVISYTLAIFELYSFALAKYPKLRTASQRVLFLAMVIATTVSVLSIFPDVQFGSFGENDRFLLVNVIRRGVYTSLLVFLVLLVSFITIFPIRLSRNTIVHIIVFSTSFLFITVATLTVNLKGLDIIPIFNLAAAFVAVVASLVWYFMLTPAGESVETTMPSRLSANQAGTLLAKLQSINDSLADTRKRL